MKNKLFLFLILLLAFVLRFYRLGDYPALNADEAALGYNAYSLIETGKDEHGNSWPIHFQSFNDYKPGLYVYLILPFVKVFGLNEWSVRVPNALLGVLTVFLIYLFVMRLFEKQIGGSLSTAFRIKVAMAASLMLAISPWHIHFSRGGWEVNTATFLILLGTYLFIRPLSNHTKEVLTSKSGTRGQTDEVLVGHKINLVFLFLSAFIYSLSLYAYHAARIIAPLLVFGVIGIYFEEFKRNFRSFLLAGLVGLVAVSPLVFDFLRPEVSSRASGVGLLADSGPLERVNEQRGEHGDFNSGSTQVLHNKLVNYGLRFLKNYSDHFHGLFLFLSGDDIQRNKVPETGQMYMLDFLWIIIGVWWIVKNWSRENRVIVHWLLVAPVATALTFQSPHALRAQNMVIPLVVISATGFCVVIQRFSGFTSKFKLFGYLIVSLLITWQFGRYVHMYYKHMSVEYPYSSQYGLKELVEYVRASGNNYENIVVTTRYDQPYILFLFYLLYPPEKFQNDHSLTPRDNFGFSTVPAFDKFVFKPIEWDFDRTLYPNSLIIGTSEEISAEGNIVKRIYGQNNFEYFEVVAN